MTHVPDEHDSADATRQPDEASVVPFTRRRPRRSEWDQSDFDEPAWSTWPEAAHGPTPFPDWLVTSANAVDAELGVLKSGKEADVHLLARGLPDEPELLLAVKRYRSSEKRMFHRDASYVEGRRDRRSRENRAMLTRTEFGRDLLAGRWAQAEFDALSTLWSLGAPVPYPVQLAGRELMMEFHGTPDGVAAPRLSQSRPSRREAADLFDQLRDALTLLAQEGFAHGDLSAYNLLVDDGRLVMIDLPQIVDIATNPRGPEFLQRDCANICAWFQSHGYPAADSDELFGDLMAESVANW
ncbi:MAG: serine protein kinase RIO [Jatrophihabitans sp.]